MTSAPARRTGARVTRERLVEEAVVLLDEHGDAALTLSAVARRLGVRTPSLYHHVVGLDGLRHEVRVHGIGRLGDALQRATAGRARRAALEALAGSYVAFARAHPGLYALTLAGGTEGDPRVERAAARVIETVLAVLAGYGLEGDAALHATRYLRSVLHGFVSLERAGGFALALDLEASFGHLLDAVDVGLASASPRFGERTA